MLNNLILRDIIQLRGKVLRMKRNVGEITDCCNKSDRKIPCTVIYTADGSVEVEVSPQGIDKFVPIRLEMNDGELQVVIYDKEADEPNQIISINTSFWYEMPQKAGWWWRKTRPGDLTCVFVCQGKDDDQFQYNHFGENRMIDNNNGTKWAKAEPPK